MRDSFIKNYFNDEFLSSNNDLYVLNFKRIIRKIKRNENDRINQYS